MGIIYTFSQWAPSSAWQKKTQLEVMKMLFLRIYPAPRPKCPLYASAELSRAVYSPDTWLNFRRASSPSIQRRRRSAHNAKWQTERENTPPRPPRRKEALLPFAPPPFPRRPQTHAPRDDCSPSFCKGTRSGLRGTSGLLFPLAELSFSGGQPCAARKSCSCARLSIFPRLFPPGGLGTFQQVARFCARSDVIQIFLIGGREKREKKPFEFGFFYGAESAFVTSPRAALY